MQCVLGTLLTLKETHRLNSYLLRDRAMLSMAYDHIPEPSNAHHCTHVYACRHQISL